MPYSVKVQRLRLYLSSGRLVDDVEDVLLVRTPLQAVLEGLALHLGRVSKPNNDIELFLISPRVR